MHSGQYWQFLAHSKIQIFLNFGAILGEFLHLGAKVCF